MRFHENIAFSAVLQGSVTAGQRAEGSRRGSYCHTFSDICRVSHVMISCGRRHARQAAAAAEASVLREQVKQLEALKQCVETVKTVAATCWQYSLRSSRRGSESLMGLMPESSVSPFGLAATLPKNSEGRRLAASMNQSIHEVS